MPAFNLADFIDFVAERAKDDPDERYPLEFGPLHQFGFPDVTEADLKGVPKKVFNHVQFARPFTWGGLHRQLLALQQET